LKTLTWLKDFISIF